MEEETDDTPISSAPIHELPSYSLWYRRYLEARMLWDEGCALLSEAPSRENDLAALHSLSSAILLDHSAIYLTMANSGPLFRLMDRLEDVENLDVHVLASMLFLIGQQKSEALEELQNAVAQNADNAPLHALLARVASSLPDHPLPSILASCETAMRLVAGARAEEDVFQYHFQKAQCLMDRCCPASSVIGPLEEPPSAEVFAQQLDVLRDLVVFLSHEPADHPFVCHAHASLTVLYCRWARGFARPPADAISGELTPATAGYPPCTAWDRHWAAVPPMSSFADVFSNAPPEARPTPATFSIPILLLHEAARHHRFAVECLRCHCAVPQRDVNYQSPVGMHDSVRDATRFLQRASNALGLTSPPSVSSIPTISVERSPSSQLVSRPIPTAVASVLPPPLSSITDAQGQPIPDLD